MCHSIDSICVEGAKQGIVAIILQACLDVFKFPAPPAPVPAPPFLRALSRGGLSLYASRGTLCAPHWCPCCRPWRPLMPRRHRAPPVVACRCVLCMWAPAAPVPPLRLLPPCPPSCALPSRRTACRTAWCPRVSPPQDARRCSCAPPPCKGTVVCPFYPRHSTPFPLCAVPGLLCSACPHASSGIYLIRRSLSD